VVAKLFVGEKVRLTAFEPRDLAILTCWYQDAEFMRLFDAEAAHPKTERQVAEYVDGQQRSPTAFVFAIRPLNSDQMVGYTVLDGIIWSQGIGWVAIGIGDPALRGKGIGSDAMRLLLNFAFGELNLRRVQLTVFAYNVPAMRLYKKLGFQREGLFREFLMRDGQVYDLLLYALLRREWTGGQPPAAPKLSNP
jgi:RimJ/RimL family protein N-acetyltransferase